MYFEVYIEDNLGFRLYLGSTTGDHFGVCIGDNFGFRV